MRTNAENAGFPGEFEQSGAQSGAVTSEIDAGDARLVALIESWPTLSEATKDEIVALAQAAGIATH